MKYKLLKTQKKFLEVPHNEELDVCVYQGGFGSGKTWAGSLLGTLLCLKFPGINGLCGAQTYSLVRDTTLEAYFEHFENFGLQEGNDWQFIKSQQKIVFKNGSSILFRHFDEPNKLKSLNLGFAEIEEMSDIPEATFKMLLGRMRQKKKKTWRDFKYRIFGHTNPQSRRGWIYKNFYENKKPNWRLVLAPSTENIYLPENFCENLKSAYDENYYKKNVLGEFEEDNCPLVVPNFSENNIQKVNYLEFCDLHISCDFNVDPMCWVLAHIDSHKVYFFDEIVLENTTTVKTCEEFAKRYPAHKGKIIINGDASGDNRSCVSEYTNYMLIRNFFAQKMKRNVEFHLRQFNPPIKNRVAAFCSLVKSMDSQIRILIDPKCEKLIYNLNNLKYREGGSNIDIPTYWAIKNNKELKFLSHPFDAASYLVEYYFPII